MILKRMDEGRGMSAELLYLAMIIIGIAALVGFVYVTMPDGATLAMIAIALIAAGVATLSGRSA
jgi:uncharacterized membrane protein